MIIERCHNSTFVSANIIPCHQNLSLKLIYGRIKRAVFLFSYISQLFPSLPSSMLPHSSTRNRTSIPIILATPSFVARLQNTISESKSRIGSRIRPGRSDRKSVALSHRLLIQVLSTGHHTKTSPYSYSTHSKVRF